MIFNNELYGLKIQFFHNPLNHYIVNKQMVEESFINRIFGYYDWVKMESISLKNHSLLSLFDDYSLHINPEEKSADMIFSACYEKQYIRGYTDETTAHNFIMNDNDQEPLVVISQIRITRSNNGLPSVDSQKTKLDFPLREYKNRLESILLDLKEMRSVRFKIFYSFGYGNFTIVFKTNLYSPVLSALNLLKENMKTLPDTIFFTESTHSIIAIHKYLINQWKPQKECEYGEVFLSLRPGVHSKTITDTINSRLNQISEEDSNEAKGYLVFGKYDTRTKITLPERGNESDLISPLLSLTKGKPGMVFSNNDFLCKNIRYSQIQWYFNIPDSPPDNKIEKYQAKNSYKNVNEFWKKMKLEEFIFFFKNLADRDDYEYTIFRSLDRVNNYSWQIIHNELITTKLEYTFIEILTIYYQNLLTYCGADEKLIKEIALNNSSDEIMTKKKEIKNALLSRKTIETDHFLMILELMKELGNSDQMVLQTPINNANFFHPSLKLFEYYHTITHLLGRKINELFRDRNPAYTKLFFSLTTNHSDVTTTINLFPNTQLENRLILVQLSWKDFISTYETLPLIIHKIGLFCCPDVTKRNKSFLLNVCREYAIQLLIELILDLRISFVISTLNNEVRQKFDEDYLFLQEKLSKKIHKIIITERDDVVIDFKEINIDNFAKIVEKKFLAVFGIWNNEINEVAEEIKQIVDHYKNNGHEKALIIESIVKSLFREGQIDINLSERFPLIRTSLQLVDEKIYEELVDPIERFISIFGKNKSNFEDKLRIIASTIIEHTSRDGSEIRPGSRKNGKSFVFTALSVDQDSKAGIALMRHFAMKKLTEDNETNRKFLFENLLYVFQNILVLTNVEINLNLFIETSADLLMVTLLDIPYKNYQEIVENGAVQNNYLMKKRIENIRRFIGIDHDKVNSKGEKRISGFSDEYLFSYLKVIQKKMKSLAEDPDIQKIRNLYKMGKNKGCEKCNPENTDTGKDHCQKCAVRDLNLLSEYIGDIE